MSAGRVLVTGGSGFVGSRLVPRLLACGLEVRCLTRTPARLDASTWRSQVTVAVGKVGGDLSEAVAGIETAVYLVHSIGQGDGWQSAEVRDATNFATCAARAGIGRIVYLGGLGNDADQLSEHLKSRHDVGRALASSGIEVVELRAAVIIGTGSASFEMLRSLVDVLPVMVTPKWVETRCQPMAITDIIELLVRAIVSREPIGGVYDAGGQDVVTYSELMAVYAAAAGLPRRWLLRVPVLTPRLSSLWVGLVTPIPLSLARALVESLTNEVVVSGRSACEAFSLHPLALREAVSLALAATSDTHEQWSSHGDIEAFRPTPTDPLWSGGTTLVDVRSATTGASPDDVFGAIGQIGGAHGWHSAGWLWWLRGLLDQLVGGPGLRRGRPAQLAVGSPLDFWRIEMMEPGRRLRLRAEMRLPGTAWLTWDLDPQGTGTLVTQTACFRPRGLLGRLYWLGVLPFHRFVFPQMLAGLVASCEAEAARPR